MADLEVLHPLHELLRSTTVSALMKERDIISVSSDAAIDEALRTLAEHRLLSVPVRVDPGEGQADDSPFLFLDIRDVLNSFMQGGWGGMGCVASSAPRTGPLTRGRGKWAPRCPAGGLPSKAGGGLPHPPAPGARPRRDGRPGAGWHERDAAAHAHAGGAGHGVC